MLDTSRATAEDHRIAAEVATAAGELLLQTRDDLLARSADQWQIKDAGDTYAHRFIVERLAELVPDDIVLSEEGKDDPIRLTRERVWIVDPLDGTREYSENRSDWAVHIALCVGGIPAAGAVALPGLGRTLSTEPAPELVAANDPPVMVVSRTRPPAAAVVVAQALGAELLPMGSAGAKSMAVVLGEADVYAHSGGQFEWDSCAPVAVACAAGLHASRCDGSPLIYNQPDVWLPDLLICRPELAEPALAALDEAIRGG
ncbi:MAG: 3'(2'),5'-bisphosphate nucleotidase CysQ [Actinomycetota bacterium]